MIIHYNKGKDTGVRGLRPWLYRETPTPNMNQGVYKKEYVLHTSDWFESGTRFAYSLHEKEESAKKFEFMDCWVPHFEINRVFVSGKTLEKITKSRDGRRGVKGIFVSMED